MDGESTIGRGTRVRGSVHGEGDLTILGHVEGSVSVTGELVIGEGALIRSDVAGRRVTVHGAIAGNVSATEAIVLEAGARVVGDLGAPQIGVRPGALVRGMVSTGGAPSSRTHGRPCALRRRGIPPPGREPTETRGLLGSRPRGSRPPTPPPPPSPRPVPPSLPGPGSGRARARASAPRARTSSGGGHDGGHPQTPGAASPRRAARGRRADVEGRGGRPLRRGGYPHTPDHDHDEGSRPQSPGHDEGFRTHEAGGPGAGECGAAARLLRSSR